MGDDAPYVGIGRQLDEWRALMEAMWSRDGQIGTLTDLYFALTSEAGALAFEDLAAGQHNAGLDPQKSVRLLTAPGGDLPVGIRRNHALSQVDSYHIGW
jgi:hypothetical protein